MTPRLVGTLTGAVVFATMAALSGAVTVARNADETSFETDAAGLALSLGLGVAPIALAAGLLVGALAGSQRGRRAAAVAALCAYVAVGAWIWIQSSGSPRTPEEDPVRYALELVGSFVQIGTVFAIAAAVVAWWIARRGIGIDPAERELAVATASLSGPRDDWGTAMRAELVSIGESEERRRFAHSAALAAIRRGTGPWPVVLAGAAGVGAGIVTFAASRISFGSPDDGSRGIIGEPLFGLLPLILIAAVIAGTLLGGSFRAGLETAVLAWLATYATMLAVEIPEALRWYQDEGIFLLDGDPAVPPGTGPIDAALEPLTHSAFIFISVTLLVVAVLAAAVGALVLRIVRRVRRANRSAPDAAPDAAPDPRAAG